MNIVKVISTSLKDAKRKIKFYLYGRDDVRERLEISPFGIDSNPPNGLSAAYSSTSTGGQGIVLGYVNANQKADVGEIRLYSLDGNNVEANYIYVKNDGNIEIGGNADNMIRFSEMQSAFDELRDDLNNFILIFNTHNHPTAAPGPPSVSPTTGTPSAANMTLAKIDEVKTS